MSSDSYEEYLTVVRLANSSYPPYFKSCPPVIQIHQVVDEPKEVAWWQDGSPRSILVVIPFEVELQHLSIVTTKQGAGKASRSELCIHHLLDHEAFVDLQAHGTPV